MLYHAMEFLDVVMVFGLLYCLRRDWRCRLFWLIQLFQLWEVVDIYRHHHSFAANYYWARVNLCLDGFAAIFARFEFPAASALIGLTYLVHLQKLQGIDMPWEYTHDGLFWTGFYLNWGALLTLLGYAVRRPILRLWSEYVRSPA